MNNARQMTVTPDREGFALVTTLLVVLVLSVLAVGAAWLASSERKTSFAEGTHVRAVLSADAGGEAAINFIRLSDTPPPPTDWITQQVSDQATTALQGSQTYGYSCFQDRVTYRAGWDPEVYRDYYYNIQAQGAASAQANSEVVVNASKLFKAGYN